MLTALNRALGGVILDDRDKASVELARHYARQVDKDEGQTWRYGPRLLDVLIELGMTPGARASVLHGGRVKDDDDSGNDRQASALDRLRSRRERRAET